MSFLQPLMLIALPLIALPIIIHLINQWRYQTRPWGAMMFLLAANRMNRGFARIRQWLILAMRTLAIAGLIFAIARPLAGGLLGWSGGGKTDTAIVLLDRSPSMQQAGLGGISKLETGRRQLADALRTLGSTHWITIDSVTNQPLTYDSLDAMMDSPSVQAASSSADLPGMMQTALDYLQTNKPGPTEIWICSDLQEADWNADSGTWSLVREGFEALPQSVRVNLLAYPNEADENLKLRVTDVRRAVTEENGISRNELLLSMQISKQTDATKADAEAIPATGGPQSVSVEIEIEGARSTLSIELAGNQADVRNHRIPLGGDTRRGWGSVKLPADANNADNEYYFVFDDPPVRRVVVVSEDRSATRALEIAAAVTESGSDNPAVEVLTPNQLDSLALDEASLLVWQTTLPDAATAPAIEDYVNKGGQVLFFPPTRLTAGAFADKGRFLGVGWGSWQDSSQTKVMVENWRGDQDLLAATASGTGLPVGQLELSGFAKLDSQVDVSRLATVTGGDALLARVPTSKGGVYFCTASTAPDSSTLAESGVVLFVAIQRAIERGQEALGNTTSRTAQGGERSTLDWRQIAGPEEALSTEYAAQAGVYQTESRLFAVNRATSEDRTDRLSDQRVEALFEGMPFARVDDSAGNLSGLVREVWRVFLILMIVALMVEAALCIPRYRASAASRVPATTTPKTP